MRENPIILGIETSCDETSAAVLRGDELLSNVISSQIEIHRWFGGVVPEIASRNHLTAILPVIDEALDKAGVCKTDLDAIGVTYGAGLVGALLVGVSAAKALAYALNIPLYAVNHIEAHIAANYLSYPQLQPPFLAVVASGGHTGVARVDGRNDFTMISSTTDDAIGEAFDKVARALGLPYPRRRRNFKRTRYARIPQSRQRIYARARLRRSVRRRELRRYDPPCDSPFRYFGRIRHSARQARGRRRNGLDYRKIRRILKTRTGTDRKGEKVRG